MSQQWQFGPIHNRVRGVSELTDFFSSLILSIPSKISVFSLFILFFLQIHVITLTYVYTRKNKPFRVHVTGVNETLSVC